MTTTTNIQPGYKQTEVGVIPEDWEVKSIGEVLKIHHGRSQKEVVDVNGEYPILASGGQIGKANDYLYNKPSVLIGRKGTIDVPQYVETPFWTVDTLFYSVVFENNVPKLLYYIFQLIDWYQYNEASGVPSLNARTIEKIQIPLPPTKSEQTAIATALTDMDALIAAQEQLIAKKRAINQGAMQELLEAKEGWEEKKFNDVFQKLSAKNYQVNSSEYLSSGQYPIIDQGQKSIVAYTNRKDKVFRLSASAIIVFGDHTRIIKIIDFDFVIGADGTQLLLVKDNHEIRYMYQYLKYYEVPNTGYNRHFKYLKEALYIMPPKIEQTRIAQILSDMDAEIEQLGEELAKYRDMKKGMMGELLTGRKRLTF